MVSHLRRVLAPLAALAVTAMVVVIPMPSASAAVEPDPVEQLLNSLQSDPATEPAPTSDDASAPGAKLATKSSPPPAPSSDDDTAGHETADPVAPDHGRAEIADLDVDGNDVADVGHNNAAVQDDDSTTADSTILALGGQEIAGAHADSNGTQHDSFEPLAPLTDEVCAGSGDQVCLRVLYADADATDDGSTSSSSSESGVTDVCLREDPDPTAACTVGAGVSNSEGEAQRNQRTGRTTASSESSPADACVQPGPTACAAGVDLVRSEGQSDSGNSPGSASRDSYVVAGDLGGQQVGRADQPETISLPPDCRAANLLCIFLNQGETYVGDGIAGHAQEAVGVSVLPDNVVNLELGRTDSLVHNDGGEAGPPTADDPGEGPGSDAAGVGSGGPGAPGSGGDVLGVAGGVLPNAGGVWSGLLAIALFAIGAGAFFVAYSRRQVIA